MSGQVVRLRYVLRPIEDRDHGGLPILSVYRDHGVVPKASRDDNYNRTPEDLIRYLRVQPGNLVVNKMKAWSGSVAVSQYDGIVSGDYLVCGVVSTVVPRYLHYLMRSASIKAELRQRSTGIRPSQERLYWEDLAEIDVSLPVINEQRRIADFLDRETVRLESVRDCRRRQVELLQEFLSTQAYEAVRGLRVNGDRHASGVNWLADLPAGWSVQSVGWQFEVLLGEMLDSQHTERAHLRPYLRNTNVQWDRIDVSDLASMSVLPAERCRYSLRRGDLLICEGGDPGRAAIWTGEIDEMYYQKALHRARPRSYTSSRWLFYCLMAAAKQGVFTSEGNLSTIAHLTGEQLRTHKFPVPERSEQDHITARLDELQRNLVNLELRVRTQIAQLAERQQALITAGVRGEIDVTTARGVA
jgi:type I restriction enzyme S subunit